VRDTGLVSSRLRVRRGSGGQRTHLTGPGAAPQRRWYAERLWVPATWWLVAAFLVVSVWFAFAVVVGSTWALLPAAVAAAVAAGLLLGYGRLLIGVDNAQLVVGRARLPFAAVESVEILSRRQAEALRGPAADARAHLVLRPYLRAAVLLVLDDRRDATPYWYVATRRPGELAAALERAGAGVARRSPPEPPGWRGGFAGGDAGVPPQHGDGARRSGATEA